MTELDEFNSTKGLLMPDDELIGMSHEAYKAWLNTMFRGLQSIARKRIEAGDLAKKFVQSFRRYCEQWHPVVQKCTPSMHQDTEAGRLRTKGNFVFLATELPLRWFLVSANTRRRRRTCG